MPQLCSSNFIHDMRESADGKVNNKIASDSKMQLAAKKMRP